MVDSIKKTSAVKQIDNSRVSLIAVCGLLLMIAVAGIWYTRAGVVGQARRVSIPKADESESKRIEIAGQIGDSYGMVNALFSGLAFAAVFIAILIQFEEIRQTQKAQEASDRSQKQALNAVLEQTDYTFLTAYLNALVAYRDTPTVDSMPEDQWSASQRIRIILDKLQPRAIRLLGDLSIPNIRGNYLVRSMANLLDLFWMNVPNDAKEKPSNLSAVKAVIAFAKEEMRGKLSQLLAPFMIVYEAHAKSILAKATEIANFRMGKFTEAHAEAEYYSHLWTACDELKKLLDDFMFEIRIRPMLDEGDEEDAQPAENLPDQS